jgi:hypothetical protein
LQASGNRDLCHASTSCAMSEKIDLAALLENKLDCAFREDTLIG